MAFARTVLGDVDPAELGVTYAHEHLVIDGGRLVERNPDFRLDSVELALEELAPARALGLGTIVDAMPCDLGRNASKLAEISRRSGVHVIAPTGLHLAEHYEPSHWGAVADEDELSALFVADVVEGIDERDYGGPLVRRTGHRAGVVKVAGSRDRLTERDRRVFRAAAATQRATGVPILTHCSDGTAGVEQLEVLAAAGADLAHVVLSHTDKIVDRGYHRELLATGASAEYDQGFRWRDGQANGTLTVIGWMVEDGFADRILLGLDAARQGYWTAYGGAPGWTFLLDGFSRSLEAIGIDAATRRRFFVDDPARVYAFAAPRAD